MRRVAAGLADAGIVADSFDLGELQTFRFASDRIVLAVPTGHPLAECDAVRLHDLVRYEFVGLPSASALQKHVEHNAARIGHTLKTRIRLATFDGICRLVEDGVGIAMLSAKSPLLYCTGCRLVEDGVGIAIVPEVAASRCRRSMAIAAVELADHWATRQLRICVSDLEGLNPHARNVVDHLRSSAGQAPVR